MMDEKGVIGGSDRQPVRDKWDNQRVVAVVGCSDNRPGVREL